MKIIISHDVDHITVWEHKKDLIISKFIVRSFIEFGLGYISPVELKIRFKSLLENKWQNIEELMQFDKENEIPSTFFVGIVNGLGLSYSLKDAEFWIKRIQQADKLMAKSPQFALKERKLRQLKASKNSRINILMANPFLCLIAVLLGKKILRLYKRELP